MKAAKVIHYVVALTIGLYTLANFLAHHFAPPAVPEQTPPSWAATFVSYIPTIVGLLALGFDLWFWRWWPIHLLVGRPRLDGAWLGTIEPSAKSDIPEERRGVVRCALIVHQTFFSVGVTVLTEKAFSHSTASSIAPTPESPNRWVLSYSYLYTPHQKYQSESPPTVGAAELQIAGREPNELIGRYWTARLTAGDVAVALVDRNVDYASLTAVVAAAKEKQATERAEKKAAKAEARKNAAGRARIKEPPALQAEVSIVEQEPEASTNEELPVADDALESGTGTEQKQSRA